MTGVEIISAALEPARAQTFYEQADRFEAAVRTCEDVADAYAGALVLLDEAWRGAGGHAWQRIEQSAHGLLARLRRLAPREAAPQLRRAGDALSTAQARLRELRQSGQPGGDEAARAVVRTLDDAFRHTGVELSAHGGTPAAPPAVTRLAAESPFHEVNRESVDLRRLPESPNTPPPGASSPSMPMMPMGMGGMGGMGGGPPTAARKKREIPADADPGAWLEDDEGWGVVGRRPPPPRREPPSGPPPAPGEFEHIERWVTGLRLPISRKGGKND